MQFLKLFGISLLVVLLINSCKKDTSKWDLQPLDLTSYGLPIIIQAPDSDVVLNNVIAFEKGVTIIKDDFTIEVEMKDEYADASKNIDSILSKKIEEIKARENFDKILSEKPNGIIYSTNDRIIGLDHHFFYVILKNKKQFEFKEAPNVMKNYSIEDINNQFQVVTSSFK